MFESKNRPTDEQAVWFEEAASGSSPNQMPRTRSLEVILGLLPLVLGLQIIIGIVYLPAALRGNADFRAYYSAGSLLRSGRADRLYDYQTLKAVQNQQISSSAAFLPFIHPPYEALLFAPFSLLRYRAAYFAFLGLNLVCLFGSWALIRKRLWRLQRMWRWLPILLIIGFMPIYAAVIQCQDSLILLFLLAAALLSMDRDASLLAGFMLGLGLFRFQIVLPIAFLFFVWRRWRLLFGGCIASFLAVVLSAFVSGVSGLRLYAHRLYEISLGRQGLDLALYGVPVARMPTLRGLVSILHLQSKTTLSVVLILSFLLLAIAAWAGRKVSLQWQLSIAVVAAVLVGYHVLTHDLSILLVPVAVLLDQQDGRGLWNIPVIWLSTVLCFFAYDYLVALPLLTFFLFLVLRVRHGSNEDVAGGTGGPVYHSWAPAETT